jgi:tRNA dimethylallyltransferase
VAKDSAEITVAVGPTASGKSELAMELAQSVGGEIIGADSVQIYRHFDIGSGKPTAEDRQRVPHHLVDAIDPDNPIDAAEYARLADAAIQDILGRGKTPVVCGGTFLWVKALVWGLAGAPPADPDVRARHGEIAAEHGRARLHAELARVDPQAATRLAPNDFVRVSRALEVWELSGRTMSAWHAEHGFREPRYCAHLVGIKWTNEALAARIAARTEHFLAAGWVDEVKGLVARGFRDARAMRSVGYRQVRDHVEGRLATEELAPAIDRATRVFARRQRTWLRDQPVEWTPGTPA